MLKCLKIRNLYLFIKLKIIKLFHNVLFHLFRQKNISAIIQKQRFYLVFVREFQSALDSHQKQDFRLAISLHSFVFDYCNGFEITGKIFRIFRIDQMVKFSASPLPSFPADSGCRDSFAAQF